MNLCGPSRTRRPSRPAPRAAVIALAVVLGVPALVVLGLFLVGLGFGQAAGDFSPEQAPWHACMSSAEARYGTPEYDTNPVQFPANPNAPDAYTICYAKVWKITAWPSVP